MPQAHGFQPAANVDPGKCQVLMRDTGLTAMPPPPCRESQGGVKDTDDTQRALLERCLAKWAAQECPGPDSH